MHQTTWQATFRANDSNSSPGLTCLRMESWKWVPYLHTCGSTSACAAHPETSFLFHHGTQAAFADVVRKEGINEAPFNVLFFFLQGGEVKVCDFLNLYYFGGYQISIKLKSPQSV